MKKFTECKYYVWCCLVKKKKRTKNTKDNSIICQSVEKQKMKKPDKVKWKNSLSARLNRPKKKKNRYWFNCKKDCFLKLKTKKK